jgi:hypothetical protein
MNFHGSPLSLLSAGNDIYYGYLLFQQVGFAVLIITAEFQACSEKKIYFRIFSLRFSYRLTG